MTTPNDPSPLPQWVLTVARALLDSFEVGTSSRFMDEEPDLDAATVDEVAEVIWNTYKSLPKIV